MDSDAEIKRIQEFVDKENYHAAINIALSAMNEGRRQKNQQEVDLFLSVINGIVLNMSQQYGSSE